MSPQGLEYADRKTPKNDVLVMTLNCIWSAASSSVNLALLLIPLWLGEVISVRVQAMDQLVLFERNTNYYTRVKVKLTTVVEGDQKAPFSMATTPSCRGGRHSFPWIAPL